MNTSSREKSLSVPIVIVTYKDVFLWTERYRRDSDTKYGKRATQISLSADDLRLLGIDDSMSVKLTNEFGSIVVQVKLDPRCAKGYGFMPASQLINRLAGYDPTRAKRPNTKRIEATVEPMC